MQTVNIHEVKTNLFQLIERVSHGESFIITKAGKPLAKVMPLDTPTGSQVQRLGFMAGQIKVPDDFDLFTSNLTTRT